MMVRQQEKRFPTNFNDYELFEEIGEGVSATVYRALCIPLNEIVAIKILNLEKCSSDLAGNVLINSDGTVKLADFGVSACMFDTGDRQRSQNTFAGTPCWMAPEVMQQLNGYNFKADIWSFGITALELAHGHAPFSKYPPTKVLLMALQNSPPGLDYERDKRFTKTFKDMVTTCLVKDPKKRPTSEKLLKHAFFKNTHSNEYLVRTILDGLPPLGDRFRLLKGKEADFLLQDKAVCGSKVQLSQREYIRGISGWNFDLEELKTQASLIKLPSDNSEDMDMNHTLKDGHGEVDYARPTLSTERISHESNASSREDGRQDFQELGGLFASSFSLCPLQALEGYFDVYKDDDNTGPSNRNDATQSNAELVIPWEPSSQVEDHKTGKNSGRNVEKKIPAFQNIDVLGCQKFFSGSLLPERILLLRKNAEMDAEREQNYKCERNYSGPLSYRHMRGFHDHASGLVIQRKGRFKVTSSDAGLKVEPSVDCLTNEAGGMPSNPTIDSAAVLPSLQYLLQQNTMQKEQLIKLIRCVEQTYTYQMEHPDAGNTSLLQLPLASTRERRLQSYTVHLEQSIRSLTEELQILNTKNSQLERKLKASFKKGEDEMM